jgi:hypothetical protein
VVARTAHDNIYIATTRIERFLSKHEFLKSVRRYLKIAADRFLKT